jgi:vancomycin resistance protein YoaR
MRAEVGARPVPWHRRFRIRVRSRFVLRAVRVALWTVAACAGLLLAGGILLAGSSDRIPAGVSVAGIKLSGLTPSEAQDVLSSVADKYSAVPVVFSAGGRTWSIAPEELDVRVDWSKVVDQARSAGDAPLPLRGLKRLKLRLFGSELEPAADVYEAGLDFRVAQIAAALAQPARDASVELGGLKPRIVPAQAGRELDPRARGLVVAALAGFERETVPLPLRIDRPEVTQRMLEPVAAQIRAALSAPVRLMLGPTRWRVRPKRLAEMLLLPAGGSSELEIGGPKAKSYFRNLARRVNRNPEDAGFAVGVDGMVSIVPALNGRTLDVGASEEALLAAALATERRDAVLVVSTAEPELTTAEAESFGITRLLSYYGTAYAGTADRIHNLQLAVSLIDGTMVAPGETFSFNAVVGERTLERGFRTAPVIVSGEYEEGVGGGVSQVATTVFNAAWEAGLPIPERNAHALYIDRYPTGRDATVNYPDKDLKFTNDTDGWLLVRGGYDGSGISISILGPDTGRRIVSEAGPLEAIGPPKVERRPDPGLFVGERVVEDPGEPARAVTVTRRIYDGDTLLHDETWSTTYKSEPKIVRVGTKPQPKPKEPLPAAGETTPTETAPADTAPAETAPSGEEPPPGGLLTPPTG